MEFVAPNQGLQPGSLGNHARRGHVLLLRHQLTEGGQSPRVAGSNGGTERRMTKSLAVVVINTVIILIGTYLSWAQEPAPRNAGQPHPMTFFVTSVGMGKGADLGGLAGADAHCQTLAAAVGAGNHTWHAYLSTQARGDQPAVNARDRIGQGPWYNSKGAAIAQNLADLHGDTIELARLGSNLFKQSALNEKGAVINGVGDTPNMHDMLTGSPTDGRAYTDSSDPTCKKWN